MKNSINRFFLYNVIGSLAPLVFAAICIPVLTRNLGVDRFGFLTLMWALVGYFGIFDLGISKALVYHAAQSAASKNKQPLAPGILAGIQLVTIVGFLGMAGLVLFSNPLAHYLVKASSAITQEAQLALVVVGLTIPVTTIGNALRGGLEGLSKFGHTAVIKVITGSAFFVVPAVFAVYEIVNLVLVAVIFLVIRIITAIWCWLLMSRDPLYQESRHVKTTMVERKKLLSYGVWALVSAVISPLMVYGDRFIISGISGAAMVGMYAILQETLGRSIFVSASYAGALQPGFTRNSDGDQEYRKHERILLLLMLCFYVVVWLLAQPVMTWWLGKELREYQSLFLIFSVALFFNSITQLPYSFLLAKGRPDLPAKYHMVEFILYMPLCMVATSMYGLNGAAVAWMGRVMLDYGLQRWAVKEITR